MLINENQIEQLVLDELGGVITPEDSVTLRQLLEASPQAAIIRNAIYKKFSGPAVQQILAMLPETLPVEKVWARIRKRHWFSHFLRNAFGFFFRTYLIAGSYILFKPTKLL